MKNHIKKIVALLLVCVVVAGALNLPIFVNAAQTISYSSEYNSGTRGEICTSLSGTSASSYYTGSYTYENLSELSSSNLKTSLHNLMTNTHKYTSSYDDCHYKADKTDCENGNGKVTLIYTSYQATMSQWNGWNREHVWPQSLGGGNTSGGGADLHHVRPSDAGVNSSRGNKPYGNAGSGASSKYGTDPAVGVLGGTYNTTYFEPVDNVKGDVARICLYVYVRWGSDWGADSVTEVFQSVDVLLEWCELDPVDTWEMGRNEVVQSIQGNRNVFIDYPEYAWLLYGKEVPDDMITPSGMAMGNSESEGGGQVTPPEETEKPVETTTATAPDEPDETEPDEGKTQNGIISNNVYFGDTLQFMFASESKPSVTYTDGSGNLASLTVDPFVIDGEQVTVKGYPAWITRQGVPPQCIDQRITVSVDGYEETYSILEYLYTRLYVSANATASEKRMYEALIKYAKAADKVLNGVTESAIGTEYLVKVTNGTIDGKTSSDLYKLNDIPFAGITAAGIEDLAWEVSVTVDGVTSTTVCSDEEIRTLKVTGHTVVTAIEKGSDTPAADPQWTLVTDMSQLSVGDQIIIVAKDYDLALSTTQNNNNRGQTEVTKNGNVLETPSSSVQIITLEAGTVSGTFAFYTGSGYLYAASSSSNYLRTKSALDDNGSWAITVTSDGAATVIAQGTYTHNILKYNKSSSIFSCYASTSSMLSISLYVLTQQ